jgi:hypothetical protein
VAGWAVLTSASSDHVSSVFSLEGRLYGLPLRVSCEGLLRPRGAHEPVRTVRIPRAGGRPGCPFNLIVG